MSIDAIATKVMGRTKEQAIPDNGLYYSTRKRKWMIYEGGIGAPFDRTFDPHKNWTDCGMVIDRMAELGQGLSITTWDDIAKETPPYRTVTFGRFGIDLDVEVIIEKKDLKTAICEAALKAVEL